MLQDSLYRVHWTSFSTLWRCGAFHGALGQIKWKYHYLYWYVLLLEDGNGFKAHLVQTIPRHPSQLTFLSPTQRINDFYSISSVTPNHHRHQDGYHYRYFYYHHHQQRHHHHHHHYHQHPSFIFSNSFREKSKDYKNLTLICNLLVPWYHLRFIR